MGLARQEVATNAGVGEVGLYLVWWLTVSFFMSTRALLVFWSSFLTCSLTFWSSLRFAAVTFSTSTAQKTKTKIAVSGYQVVRARGKKFQQLQRQY